MFSKIMVPIDLWHEETMTRALDVAGDLAKKYDARLQLVSVCGEMPSELGHNSEQYDRRLQAFAKGLQETVGVQVGAHTITSQDPEAEVTSLLMHEIKDSGADLVVMASHVPGLAEHIFSSHGGYVAQHAKVSVFVVR